MGSIIFMMLPSIIIRVSNRDETNSSNFPTLERATGGVLTLSWPGILQRPSPESNKLGAEEDRRMDARLTKLYRIQLRIDFIHQCWDSRSNFNKWNRKFSFNPLSPSFRLPSILIWQRHDTWRTQQHKFEFREYGEVVALDSLLRCMCRTLCRTWCQVWQSSMISGRILDPM